MICLIDVSQKFKSAFVGFKSQQISKCLLWILPEFGISSWLLFCSLNHKQFEISDHKVTKELIHFLFLIQCSIQPIFAYF